MDISIESAERIVSEISAVLDEDVNLMDHTATIIASTDPGRVGDHHQGAARIIDERLDALAIRTEDCVPGVRPGLNLPINVEGDVVGVLGITGDPCTFLTSGHLLQKMTEIMMRESRVRERSEQKARSLSRFLHVWTSASETVSPALVAEGREFGIDVSRDHVVLVAQLMPERGSARGADPGSLDELTKHVIREARSRGAVAAPISSRILVLFPSESVAELGCGGAEVVDGIVSWFTDLASRVADLSQLRLVGGVSSRGLSAPQATRQAERALAHARHGTATVLRYDQLTVELLVAAIPPGARQEFVAQVFSGVPDDQRAEVQRTLRAYFAADGSLVRAAADLHIHKNTLTARLNRTAQATGLDARQSAAAAVLWLALYVSE